MNIVFGVVGAMLGLATAVSVVRLVRGPTTLDRVVAMDMIVALIVCGLATAAAATLETTVLPVMLVVALLGFTGSASVARFLGRDTQ